MDVLTVAALAGLAGAGLGGLGTAAALRTRRPRSRARRQSTPEESAVTSSAPTVHVPPGVADVLAVLRSSGIVLDTSDRVVTCSPAAVSSGLVRGTELAQPGLLALARRVRLDSVIRETELELPRGMGAATMVAHARVAPLGADHVLLLVEDRTRARQVEEIRRDFVANVSHELKTPVGGIALLAEAVLDAHDDPEAVARFARRISVESERLTRLVREIVDFSRLQGSDRVEGAVEVDLAGVVLSAVDAVRVLADNRRIEMAVGDATGQSLVWGDRDLLVTAVVNLLSNAVTYSEPGTRVAVSVRGDGETVAVAVTDQGLGISPSDQQRIFERFYRVDAARSRQTGGTGLGLAIVKHVAENHGGHVRVWSEPGHGSTFTITLPCVRLGRAGGSAADATESAGAESAGAEPAGAEPAGAEAAPQWRTETVPAPGGAYPEHAVPVEPQP